ncbi:glycoside hydrolase family 2 TIM barrel-domain containing protein [Sphingobacterium oryzagri]|uniref:Glycoside hydrolase family 2 TIM barrel-domain containing protein n=1 Tax=Sphingobacterium oryzagri TaxID=3025669 RepID=A0ABY7WEB8_9SPHI|nr:sugar-binding domain-containing protein [Sphingobacterium sp. KACC 22765]WDF66866.1 glycoside hydrolase family 2 TIM barrel-domain containing protein [Sphingobacterium sp. KACC 22765]
MQHFEYKNSVSTDNRSLLVGLDSVIRTFSILIIVSLFAFSTAYGQKSAVANRKIPIDQDWQFMLGDVSEAAAVDFDDKAWRKLDLPHDWSIEGDVARNNPSGNDGGYFPTGIGWYRKQLTIEKAQRGNKLSLYFEGIYMNAEVYVNGKLAGGRPYGYSSFEIDITPYLHYGAQNTIAVKVDNAKQKNSRWYSGSGIYRHVYLLCKPALNFTTWGTAIRTANASEAHANVDLATTIKNETNSDKTVTLTYEILDSRDKLVACDTQHVKISEGAIISKNLQISVSNVQLWSPETPNLYTARLRINERHKLIDEISIPFGMRTVSYGAKEGFLLNGKSVKLNGGCVHHDNGALGAAAFDRAEYRKVELLKAAGFNAVRTSHNHPSEAFLAACDQIGLLVMDESFDGWRTGKNTHDYATIFDEWWQKDIESMVLRDRNHPAVIMWSTGNEIIERKEPQAVETATKLANLVRKLDPSRPVTSAITTWDQDWEIFDPLFAAHDIGGYNYQLHRAPSDHQRVPTRVIVQTESYPRDAFANWKLVQENNYIIGDFVWTAMDYLGESGIGRYFYVGETEGQHYDRDIFPWHGAYCGDIDLMVNRKPISHYRELLYNEDKKLHLAVKEPNGYFGQIKETIWSVWPTWESWTWPGHEGKEIEVEVYSRYPLVRLYLNDHLIGEKSVSQDTEFKASFIMPYQAGNLRAVGVENQGEKESSILKTAGKATHLQLKPDRKAIRADGQDLSFIAVEITDEQGIISAHAENKISFTIDGPGEIIAVDNANLQDEDNYTKNFRKAWKGKAMVIVRTTNKSGNIRVSANANGLETATVTLQSR